MRLKRIKQSKIKNAVIYSIGISVLLHLMFFTCAGYIRIPGVYSILAKTKRFFNIKAIKAVLPIRKAAGDQATYIKPLRFESPVDSDVVTARMTWKEKTVKKRAFRPQSQTVTEPVQLSKLKDSDYLRQKGDKAAVDKASQRTTREELVSLAGRPDRTQVVSPEDVLGKKQIPEDFYEKMPGFTPTAGRKFLDSAAKRASAKVPVGYRSVIAETDAEGLEEYLLYTITTYQDPKDKQKYYKIGISVGRDIAEFARIPKEIIFLVDCSSSIKQVRLKELKEGLHYCLTHLNAGDHFNILAFKKRIIRFKPHPVLPEESNIKDALKFIDNLTVGETTDTYNALYKSIKEKRVVKPSYIILLSDGRPTEGITDSTRIINEISRINKGTTPIFAFSGGVWVNRYLLDFITYKNRGWTEYATRTHFIGEQLSRMYEKIKDPMLLNVRYYVSGLQADEMFPRVLPDFFRNAEFSVYGTYTDEDEFSLQLRGEMNEKGYEFLLDGALDDAIPGDKTIARNWAFNKIYHLIGQLEHNKKNTEIIQEIKALSKRFNIHTPYMSEIIK